MESHLFIIIRKTAPCNIKKHKERKKSLIPETEKKMKWTEINVGSIKCLFGKDIGFPGLSSQRYFSDDRKKGRKGKGQSDLIL